MTATASQPSHPGELWLRRLHAGEPSAKHLEAHVEGCDRCRARLKGFDDEQRRFETELPFERFAAGVERASRTPSQADRQLRWRRAAIALAAGLVLAIALPFGLSGRGEADGTNRLKGGTGIEVVVRGEQGVQRLASVDPLLPEPLAPGDRLRIGFRAGTHTRLVVVSIDEAGQVTPIEPASGEAVVVQPTGATEFLPGSLELTGQGLERIVVVLGTEALSVDEVVRAARHRYDEARGNLAQLGRLDVPGEQFHRTFLKP